MRGCLMPALVLMVVIVGGVYGLYKLSHPSYSWHQKITVTVETPDGVKSGFSVQQVLWRRELGVMGSPIRTYRTAEAVVVEVKNGRYLFLLLGKGRPIAQYTLLPDFLRGRPFKERGNKLEEVGLKGDIPRKHYPLLVTFDDITKPETVRRVVPDNLAATFGQGYALKSITLEITNEPITQGRVEKVLGWLGRYKENNFRLNGERCVACPKDRTLAAKLAGSNFAIWSN